MCNKIASYGGTRRNSRLWRYWPLYPDTELRLRRWTRNISSTARYDATNALCVLNRVQQSKDGWSSVSAVAKVCGFYTTFDKMLLYEENPE